MKITKELCRLIYLIYTHITMKHIKTSLLAAFCAVSLSITGQQSSLKSLVPDEPSKAPDYLCTWNLQGYVVSYQGSDPTREAMNEEYMFEGCLPKLGRLLSIYPQRSILRNGRFMGYP